MQYLCTLRIYTGIKLKLVGAAAVQQAVSARAGAVVLVFFLKFDVAAPAEAGKRVLKVRISLYTCQL